MPSSALERKTDVTTKTEDRDRKRKGTWTATCPVRRLTFVLALDGQSLAYTGPHGQKRRKRPFRPMPAARQIRTTHDTRPAKERVR
jgi:hypothetical protein